MPETTKLLKARIASLERQLTELNTIGVSLSTEKNLDRLLEKILTKAREITAADSGSLFLVEKDGDTQQRLRFELAQNDSVEIAFSEFTIPINKKSIVGYAVLKGSSLTFPDVYEIDSQSEFQHNRGFDMKIGYRTKSMLVVPLKNQQDEVIGVLQLINKKTASDDRLTDPALVDMQVLSFSDTDLHLVESMASQASVAIENARLYADIENLFDGFIRASVQAIESRDPTTSGHSFRVAELTCGLAEVVSKATTGPYRDIVFGEKDIRELRYASLLHDFGKIGVREEVLVKAKKLLPANLDILENRFQLIRRTLEVEHHKRKVDYLLQRSREEAMQELPKIDNELNARLQEIDQYIAFILKSNEPTVLPEGAFDQLAQIASQTYLVQDAVKRPYLTEDEVRFLSIRKGSLSEEERLAIESHVVHSYNFLKQIPWTKELRNIPSIAYAHHEKLNGKGYPRKIQGDQIPFQTKIMTISDIFDALSARDRPYKKAVPVQKALDILKMEVQDGLLDAELYRLFLESKIYTKVIDD